MVGMTTDTRLHVPPHEELEKEKSEMDCTEVAIITVEAVAAQSEQLVQTFDMKAGHEYCMFVFLNA